ncbi:MAG TPA: patatin-like phospholipase family protein [Candidatus Dormibacteraeota bacterium]|nr:patatin-like phospholipase family protein [Candidatus Dormibacteraeota bacterium]
MAPAPTRQLDRRRKPRTALVLAGGGITGGIYQVGALRALDDVLINRSVLDFDIYVGTSAGAFVATLLAVGIPPWAIAEAARNPSLGLQLRLFRHVFSPNLAELWDRAKKLPGRLPAMVSELAQHRGSFLLSDLAAFASLILPSGILDSRQLGRFMGDLLKLAEVPTDFSQLDRQLYIVACELDSWQRVVFGGDTKPKVSIPDAVAASAAIPVLFRPVTINGSNYVDGGTKGPAAIDVAIDHGATLVIVVNPLVPLDVRANRKPDHLHGLGNSIVDLGFRAITNQLARGMVHDSLTAHVQALQSQHPDVDIVLIEPNPNDEKMFFHEIMSTSARLVVAQHGYESVLETMGSRSGSLAKVLSRHGLEASFDLFEGKPWTVPVENVEPAELEPRIQRTVTRPRGPRKASTPRLERAMDRLEAQFSEKPAKQRRPTGGTLGNRRPRRPGANST